MSPSAGVAGNPCHHQMCHSLHENVSYTIYIFFQKTEKVGFVGSVGLFGRFPGDNEIHSLYKHWFRWSEEIYGGYSMVSPRL